MLRLAADENFNNNIVRGLLRRKPDLDIVRIQDAGLSGADDPTVLEWSAQEGRILLTHDVSTITHHAHERVRAGKSMPARLQRQITSLPWMSADESAAVIERRRSVDPRLPKSPWVRSTASHRPPVIRITIH